MSMHKPEGSRVRNWVARALCTAEITQPKQPQIKEKTAEMRPELASKIRNKEQTKERGFGGRMRASRKPRQ